MIVKRGQLFRAKTEDLQRLAKWLQIDTKNLTHQQIVHLIDKKINAEHYFFDIC